MTKLKLANVIELELPIRIANWNDSRFFFFLENKSWYDWCRIQIVSSVFFIWKKQNNQDVSEDFQNASADRFVNPSRFGHSRVGPRHGELIQYAYHCHVEQNKLKNWIYIYRFRILFMNLISPNPIQTQSSNQFDLLRWSLSENDK